MKILIALVVVLVLWSLWGYFSSRVEQAEYTVTKETDDYEIRAYAPHIVAQATVEGSYREALNRGFTIVAGYIFGGNQKQEKVAMTAPVTAEPKSSEKIAMTAPVTAESEAPGVYTISFVMPHGYTLQTLPTPTDSRVQLREVPAKTYAATRFTWYWTDKRIAAEEAKLLAVLVRDGVVVKGKPFFAGYNAPWTPPWLIRNEVLVEI